MRSAECGPRGRRVGRGGESNGGAGGRHHSRGAAAIPAAATREGKTKTKTKLTFMSCMSWARSLGSLVACWRPAMPVLMS